MFPKTARPHREIFLPAPARRPLDFFFPVPSALWTFHFPNRFPKSDSPRIVCLTADQSEIVLSFDCTLSSLKMIVIVSLP